MNTGPRRTADPTFHPRWEHIAGNQACLSHLIRDYEDCAESYPGAVWPVQAQRALRALIRAWHAAREQGLDAIPAGVREPLEREFRHAVLAGPGQRAPRPRPEEQHETEARPRAAGILPRPPQRRADLHRGHQRVAHEQYQRSAESGP